MGYYEEQHQYDDVNIRLHINNAIGSSKELIAAAHEIRRMSQQNKPIIDNIATSCKGNGEFGVAITRMVAKTYAVNGGLEQVAARLEEIAEAIIQTVEELQMEASGNQR